MGSVEGREDPKRVLSPVRAAFAIFAKFANFKFFMSDRLPQLARVTTQGEPARRSPSRRTIKSSLPSWSNITTYPTEHQRDSAWPRSRSKRHSAARPE